MPSKTRLAWATDIHLNAVEDPAILDRFVDDLNRSQAFALLLGGDIAEAEDVQVRLMDLAVKLNMPIYYVLGNHDFYGSDIQSVRREALKQSTAALGWLPATGPIQLSAHVALVGHDGWGDAQFGDFSRAEILTDYLAIVDLTQQVDMDDVLSGFTQRDRLKEKLRQLGAEAADVLRPQLEEAAAGSTEVIVLTHVPPFREVCLHKGIPSEDHWLPGFTCGALGDLIKSIALKHPGCRFTVLSGHTHSSAYARLQDNLQIHCGAAAYGRLKFRLIELPPKFYNLDPN